MRVMVVDDSVEVRDALVSVLQLDPARLRDHVTSWAAAFGGPMRDET